MGGGCGIFPRDYIPRSFGNFGFVKRIGFIKGDLSFWRGHSFFTKGERNFGGTRHNRGDAVIPRGVPRGEVSDDRW